MFGRRDALLLMKIATADRPTNLELLQLGEHSLLAAARGARNSFFSFLTALFLVQNKLHAFFLINGHRGDRRSFAQPLIRSQNDWLIRVKIVESHCFLGPH